MTLVRTPPFTCPAMLEHGRAVVAVSGELDMSTVPELLAALAELLEQRPHLVTLDLAGMSFIDSTGLTLLVRTSKRLAEHAGSLQLARATPQVRRVLEIVGLDRLLGA